MRPLQKYHILHDFMELYCMNLELPKIYHFSKRSIISDMNYGMTYMLINF